MERINYEYSQCFEIEFSFPDNKYTVINQSDKAKVDLSV
jgi:hypothetical protein